MSISVSYVSSPRKLANEFNKHDEQPTSALDVKPHRDRDKDSEELIRGKLERSLSGHLFCSVALSSNF